MSSTLLDSTDSAVSDAPATECSGSATVPSREVVLADGSPCDLSTLTQPELLRLQFEQEQAFAKQFVAFPKRSAKRATAFAQGYDTVTSIFAAANGMSGPVVMGLDARYERLVVGLLERQRRGGMTPKMFEVGYGCGALLARVAKRGFDVGGIEVSPAMHRQAVDVLGSEHHVNLLLGDLMADNFPVPKSSYTLCYWNDVFEHVAPDEISDYLERIYDLLAPGGLLVTITPNWHVRPNDVTGDFFPPRTEAQGVHLKEYSLREVTRLLRAAGFNRVATPLVVTPKQIMLCGGGLSGVKRMAEPLLEWLPFKLTQLLVRGLGLSCTIAQRQ